VVDHQPDRAGSAGKSLEDRITEEVRALERLDLAGLRDEWRRRYGRPPKLRSPVLLGLMLAWRIQAAAFGGLDATARRRLRAGPGAAAPADRLSDGVRITRAWRGQDYLVETVHGRYRWNGSIYPSLSAVATAITGVKRNGPQFFGLRSAP
jgi:hypothetical protein